jgi:uncharacterized protein (DUF4415 family)
MSKHITPPEDTDDWFPTEKELKKLRPLMEVDSALLLAHQNGAIIKRGRPKATRRKELVSLRLDPLVLAAYKASGKGWQTRVNAILLAALQSGSTTPAN